MAQETVLVFMKSINWPSDLMPGQARVSPRALRYIPSQQQNAEAKHAADGKSEAPTEIEREDVRIEKKQRSPGASCRAKDNVENLSQCAGDRQRVVGASPI